MECVKSNMGLACPFATKKKNYYYINIVESNYGIGSNVRLSTSGSRISFLFISTHKNFQHYSPNLRHAQCNGGVHESVVKVKMQCLCEIYKGRLHDSILNFLIRVGS